MPSDFEGGKSILHPKRRVDLEKRRKQELKQKAGRRLLGWDQRQGATGQVKLQVEPREEGAMRSGLHVDLKGFYFLFGTQFYPASPIFSAKYASEWIWTIHS